jgi:hypothetical protein
MTAHIKVATLNFSGINNSPFEYHDGTEVKKKLDEVFHRLLLEDKIYSGPDFLWKHGKVDMVFQKERYTPAYQVDAGVVRGKFLTLSEFSLIWDYEYQRHLNLFESSKDKPCTQENLDRTKLFDLLLYRTFITYVYGEFDETKLKDLDPKPYLAFNREMHSKSYLVNEKKMERVSHFVEEHSLDVMFVQEAGFEGWDNIVPTTHGIKRNNDSMIIYKKDVFRPDDNKGFEEMYGTKLNLNNDSVHLLTKSHLLVSGHLTSKAHNVEQAAEMFEVLDSIMKDHPHLHIIIGIDANHYLGGREPFNIFPDTDKCITTSKQRTYLQLQYNKSNKLVQEVKDAILTNLKITKSRITDVQGKEATSSLLPNDNHPYDHLVVMCYLEIIVSGSPKKFLDLDPQLRSELSKKSQKDS